MICLQVSTPKIQIIAFFLIFFECRGFTEGQSNSSSSNLASDPKMKASSSSSLIASTLGCLTFRGLAVNRLLTGLEGALVSFGVVDALTDTNTFSCVEKRVPHF
jgi:hypothetical protein